MGSLRWVPWRISLLCPDLCPNSSGDAPSLLRLHEGRDHSRCCSGRTRNGCCDADGNRRFSPTRARKNIADRGFASAPPQPTGGHVPVIRSIPGRPIVNVLILRNTSIPRSLNSVRRRLDYAQYHNHPVRRCVVTDWHGPAPSIEQKQPFSSGRTPYA